MLIILQELMYRSFVETEGRPPKREEIPKPCDYFDLIAGTGTGGLIAIMLGRLRLDIEVCMETYVRMTKKVFETDKTIAGIPYKHTLFKASKLEEAIRACVREHTIFEDEGNDGTETGGKPFQASHGMSAVSVAPRRSVSVRSNATMGLNSPTSARSSMISPSFPGWGNSEATLYDARENRTKTAVTAVYKGTKKNDPSTSIFLRSYESRKESAPDFNCTIWQAGRATSAIGLAFKPIQIGQNTFIDEGAGKYNPSPQILEEAAVNEWPGRDIGVFVSIGTGKRPGGTSTTQSEWWEGFVGGSVGAFAEARRRLITKIEGCEDTHIQMLNTELTKRRVPVENYCRLNVEVGVGEFGMNEWDRVSDMNTSTRRYLGKPEVQELVYNAAVKIAKIELTTRRYEGRGHASRDSQLSYEGSENEAFTAPTTTAPPPDYAVELPANDTPPIPQPRHDQYRYPSNPSSYYQSETSSHDRYSSQDKYMAIPEENNPHRLSAELPARTSTEDEYGTSSPPIVAPPRPPKTPINGPETAMPFRPTVMGRSNGNPKLPYPDTDGPPPIVNKARKPEIMR